MNRCDVCGLEKKKGICPAENKQGDYFVCISDGIVYSTDSPFWYDFFLIDGCDRCGQK